MPTFPTKKSAETTISTCGKFIRLSDGCVFRRTVLKRGEMKSENPDDALVENVLSELDQQTVGD